MKKIDTPLLPRPDGAVTDLVRYDAMCRAIDAAYEVDEVKAIHDQAAMLQAAARVANNVEAETRAYEIRMRAARRAGELSKKIEKAQGQRSDLVALSDQVNPSKKSVLGNAGISKQQASEWERLASVPKDEFEEALTTRSVRELINKPAIIPVSNDALGLIGTLRDFERRGYLEKTPAHFMATMTPTMLEEVYHLAPLAAAWLATIKE
jgi:hypothetical protein